jgi:threonine efflux protein
MSYLSLLLSLMMVDLLAAISPGPNFVLVTRTAIQRTRSQAAAVVLGFASANLIWCAAVVFGLSALFDFAPWLYSAIKFIGGMYLVYLGVTLWRAEDSPGTRLESVVQTNLAASYIRGLLTNLSNPKSVVYFGSIFALFMKPATPSWVQLTAVGIVLFDTVLWYGTVALLFSSGTVRRIYSRVQRPINRVTGAVMIAFGFRLILARDRIL